MSLDLSATLRDLVATPSVNPMGRAVSGPDYFEYRLTDYLEQLFVRFNIKSWRQSVAPKRDNIIARIEGSPSLEQGGALLLLEVHQDTVPVDGMMIPPFGPQVRDGRLYGRGACDNKGGMAAMLAAMVRLKEEVPTPRPTVVLACTVNEEHGFTGASALTTLWSNPASPIIPRRPDVAIVAEPTNLNVVVAHKGMVRWRCHTLGRAAHSSQPEQGENAIFRMAQVLTALERYQQNVVGRLAQHPLCGRPTLSVGTISGGLSVNTVPDRCMIEIDRRLVPGEQPQHARQHVIDYLAAETSLGEKIQHDPPFMQGTGLNDAHNHTVAEKLATAIRSTTGRTPKLQGVSFGTDAFCYDAAGVPSVVFGPGSIDQAHTADEWVPLAEVDQAAEVLYRVIAQWSISPEPSSIVSNLTDK
jgi:acetylornithine deacetylase